MENGDFFSRKATPEEAADFRERNELANQVMEFESVYRDLYPNQWVGFLNNQVVMWAETYEEFVAQFDDFSWDDRRRILTRNFRIVNNGPILIQSDSNLIKVS